MNKKDLRRYFEKQWILMQGHLDDFIAKKKQEDLHKFRVQVKKLQALVILFEQKHHPVRLRPALKPLKKIFRQAGKLRTAYISDKLTGSQHCHGKDIDDFCSMAAKRRKRIRNIYRVTKKLLSAVDDKSIRKFYRSELHGIAADLSSQLSSRQLHDCRKRMKVLLYNYPLVYKSLDFTLDTAYMDELQEKIGDWHDRWLAQGILPAICALPAGNFYERAVYNTDEHHVCC